MFSRKLQAPVESLNPLTSAAFPGLPKSSLKDLDCNLEARDHKLNKFPCRMYIKIIQRRLLKYLGRSHPKMLFIYRSSSLLLCNPRVKEHYGRTPKESVFLR